jgi:hypothetical protein
MNSALPEYISHFLLPSITPICHKFDSKINQQRIQITHHAHRVVAIINIVIIAMLTLRSFIMLHPPLILLYHASMTTLLHYLIPHAILVATCMIL